MKQLEIKKTGDVLYHDTLDNGLQVFIVPKEGVNTTFVSFNVKYGAIHNAFKPLGEDQIRELPHGIAHFLEHKMFAQENGIDPMMFYAANGADVNAYTSLYNTSYHFSCSSHLKENLEYLLDFVQSPYFTDENVDKEKGIIEEEINMYNDDPYSYLDERVRFNAFKEHAIKYSIAGTVEDINSITKEDLYTCYHTFYHPSNMFLVISGKCDPTELFEVIKENQSKKEFKKSDGITLKSINEPNEVGKESEEKEMAVEVSKVAYGLKIPFKGINMESKRRDLYLAILFDSLFGATSQFNEQMRDKGYLLSYAVVETTYTESHIFITINADTEHVSELIASIKETLNKMDIDKDDFANKVKMFISNDIYTYDDVEAINRYIVNDLILYGKYYANTSNLLSDFKMNELNQLIESLDISNTTTLIIKPMSK